MYQLLIPGPSISTPHICPVCMDQAEHRIPLRATHLMQQFSIGIFVCDLHLPLYQKRLQRDRRISWIITLGTGLLSGLFGLYFGLLLGEQFEGAMGPILTGGSVLVGLVMGAGFGARYQTIPYQIIIAFDIRRFQELDEALSIRTVEYGMNLSSRFLKHVRFRIKEDEYAHHLAEVNQVDPATIIDLDRYRKPAAR